MALKTTPSLFVALAESIVYQQLTGKAAATIFARVRALFPARASRPHARADPSRQRRAAARSRPVQCQAPGAARSGAAKRRRQRAHAREVRSDGRRDADRAAHRSARHRPLDRRDAVDVPAGRPDVLPVDDYGVRQGFAIAYRKRKLPLPKALAKYGARWAPYRTVASWYLWRAVDLRNAAPDRCQAAASASLKDPRILGIARIRTLGIARHNSATDSGYAAGPATANPSNTGRAAAGRCERRDDESH